jgi:ectoine hydroxylase-related dioxygenase (phytanoyl-CoA dioxygenase family)
MTTTTAYTPLSLASYPITVAQKKHYDAEGYVLLRNILSNEQANLLRNEVMEIMEKIGLEPTKLKQTQQYLHGSPLDHFVHSEVMRGIASALTGGPSTLYLPFTAVKTGGGGGRFHFHQDNQYTRHDGPSINLWSALTLMTEANGCLQIVPRSHLQGTLESELSGDGDAHRKVKWEPGDFAQILMEPGDCVAFTRLTVHGSGANTTPDHRVAYAIQYHRDDVNYRDGETWKSLKEHPRFTDIHGCSEIVVPTAKRDGH